MSTDGALTCLFWNFNCNHNDKEALIARLVNHHKVDLLVLAESSVRPEFLLEHLKKTDSVFDRPDDLHKRFQVFTRFPGSCLTSFGTSNRVSARKLHLPGFQEIIVGLIHFLDRRNHDRATQLSRVRNEYQVILDAEKLAGHTRTIVFGDFNMNPFDDGMIDAASGFGAMMSRDLARRHSSNTVEGPQRFYNPSWSRFAPAGPHPPGTYYWDKSNQTLNIFWHSLDQVLVRPALFDGFRDENFRVLASLPGEGPERIELIRSTGKHWELALSDHLPILFKLDLPKEHRDA